MGEVHRITLAPGRYRLSAFGGGASDGTPGGFSEREITLTEESELAIEVGRGGSPDVPPGASVIRDLARGLELVIAPPLPPRQL